MLHILYQSPFESQHWKNCLTTCAQQDIILLIENGVFCALSETESGAQLTHFADQKKIFVLTPHAVERGVLPRLIDNIEFIDFDAFVDLTIQHYPILRW